MKKSDAVFISAAGFSAVFAIVYASIIHFKIKVPRYFPLEHTWSLNGQPGKIAQGWYGMFALAFLLALIFLLVSYLVLRSEKIKLPPMVLKLAATLMFIIVPFVLAWFVWHEFMK
jgi:hypothetical protein